MSNRVRLSTVAAALSALLPLVGCTKEKQLQAVAKDWCQTIRASQVIPVYPLTEDLQPGDVFLVQLPVDQQQEAYKKRGFLPLDNHVHRLQPGGYSDFYGNSFVDPAAAPTLPKEWIRPSAVGIGSWESAPAAAFPEYSFSVRNGVGANIGVPVYGIPVGLSLLGSQSANGTITMKDARTLGVDIVTLDRQLRDWSIEHLGFLANFAPPPGEPPRNFLRVVTRIYAIGAIDIFLTDAASGGAGIDAGVPRPVELLQPTAAQAATETPQQNISNWLAAQKTLGEALTSGALGAAPGGSLKFTSASNRTVGLDQSFNPPLVVGYLGFDVAIGQGGRLGPPVPTQALLEGRVSDVSLLTRDPIATVYSESVVTDAYEALKSVSARSPEAAAAVASLDGLAAGTVGPVDVATRAAGGTIAVAPYASTLDGYPRYRNYRASLRGSVAVLEAEQMVRPLTPAEGDALTSARAWLEDNTTNSAASTIERDALMTYVRLFVLPN